MYQLGFSRVNLQRRRNQFYIELYVLIIEIFFFFVFEQFYFRFLFDLFVVGFFVVVVCICYFEIKLMYWRPMVAALAQTGWIWILINFDGFFCFPLWFECSLFCLMRGNLGCVVMCVWNQKYRFNHRSNWNE